MQASRPRVARFAYAIASLVALAFVIFAWGRQLQADCLPNHGTLCSEDVVPNELAFGAMVGAVGLAVVGLAMWLYTVGVNGFLEDLQTQAGEPVSKRRK